MMKEYKMYIWNRDVLTSYTSGLAIAVATSIEEAREIIIKEYMKWILPDGAGPVPYNLRKKYDSDELEHWGIAKDIQCEPDKILDLPCGTFISGGD